MSFGFLLFWEEFGWPDNGGCFNPARFREEGE
jgi:hypothetical protein